jgi:hypothetical protein
MVLADYVNQTLDGLLKTYIDEINKSKNNKNNSNFVIRFLDADRETYSKIIGGMKKYSDQFEDQLNPEYDNKLRYRLKNFVRKSLRNKENPSQLYGQILDVYNQEVFNKGDEALVIILSKIYWEALKTLGQPDPLNGQKYYATRQDKENAARIISVIEELLGEALYKYWSSRGKDIDIDEIMDDLAEQARPFYAQWEGVKGKIEKLTPYLEVRNAVNKLVAKLEEKYISFIQGLIVSAYNARPAPEHIKNVLEDLISKDFFKNAFSEMYNEIGNYINQLQPQVAQYLQQNQPAGQQQGQQANQPNVQQPPQPPAGQQPAPQQQQAPQGGQFRQPPSPNVLRP